MESHEMVEVKNVFAEKKRRGGTRIMED